MKPISRGTTRQDYKPHWPPSASLTSVVGSPADVASIPRSVSRLTDDRGFGAGYWTSPASKRRCARSPRLARASSIATDTPIPITPQPPSQLASPLAPTPPASPTALDSRLPTLPHACSPSHHIRPTTTTTLRDPPLFARRSRKRCPGSSPRGP